NQRHLLKIVPNDRAIVRYLLRTARKEIVLISSFLVERPVLCVSKERLVGGNLSFVAATFLQASKCLLELFDIDLFQARNCLKHLIRDGAVRATGGYQ